MRAVIYARTASAEQSTISQIDRCRDFIRTHHGQIVGIYDDEGASAHDEARDGLKQLLLDASSGNFNTVVVTGYDRFARNPFAIMSLLAGLGQLGIIVRVVKKQ